MGLLLGCAHKVVVEIPPRINLESFQTIGIVEFSSDSHNASERLDQLATQNFMNMIQEAQPKVRFLELGPQEELLKSLNRGKIDPEAIKAIGEKYKVSSIFTGSYEISEVRPKISLSEDLSSVNASAMVNIRMVAKQWEAATGATLWTNSRFGDWPLANVSKSSGNPFSFSMSHPEEKYGQFITKLVYVVTDDFRPHYETRKVKK
jgi:phage antirepressor YoqD-like protein